MRYALDTNHAAALYRGDPSITARVLAAADSGALFCLPTPVVGELYYMAFNSARQAQNLARLVPFLASYVILDFDHRASVEFGRLRTFLRAKGRPIPVVDLQIAAMARAHDLVVLSADSHFRAVDGLDAENWLAGPAAQG